MLDNAKAAAEQFLTGEKQFHLGFLPTDGRNLAAAAALAFWQAQGIEPYPLDITIEKVTPVCAGLGGGSSDAAAVLRAMNEIHGTGLSLEQLAVIGQKVGSDVPYCVLGTTALAEGKGEILTTNYLNFSEPKALEKLNKLTNITLKMYDVESSGDGFHTKGYIFRKDEIYRIIIGSSNMTKTALASLSCSA